MSYNYKFLIVLTIPLLGLINLSSASHLEEKSYIFGDSIVAQANLEFGKESTSKEILQVQDNTDYHDILAWYKNPESGICPWMINYANNKKGWIKFCRDVK